MNAHRIDGMLRRLGNSARSQAPSLLIVVVVGAIIILPLAPLIGRALADNAAGVQRMLELPSFGAVVSSTALLGFGSVVVALILGITLAVAVTSLPTRWRRLGAVAPLIPLMIPSVAHVAGFAFLFSPTNGYANTILRKIPLFSGLTSGPIDVYSIEWIVLYTGFALTSFVYLFVYTGLMNLGHEYIAAATANGASRTRTFFMITIPMLRPALIYAAITVLILGLGQFTAPLLLGRGSGVSVLTTELYYTTLDSPIDYALGAAFGTPLLVVGLVFVWVMWNSVRYQTRFVGSSASYAEPIRTKTSAAIYAGIISLYVTVAAILPVLALMFVALSPFWSGNLTLDGLTLQHIESVIGNPLVLDAVITSIKVSLAAMIVVVVVGFMVAYAMLYGAARPIRGALELTSTLPLVLPAALFGLGLLFAYTRQPFRLYGSLLGLVVGYVTIMIPFAVRYQLTSIISIGPSVIEASRTAGAGPLRTIVRVVLPLTRRGVSASAAIILVLLLHEFGVSVVLRSPGTNVMATTLNDFWTHGTYPEVAVMALIMVCVTFVGVTLAIMLGGSKVLEQI